MPDATPRDSSLDAPTLDSAAQDASQRFVMPECTQRAGPFAPLSTKCQHFVDDRGRVVVLRGINARVEGVFDVTFDDGRVPLQPIPAFESSDAARMRQLGFNFLRLPINWSGVEPRMATPAVYDEGYLSRVRAVVDIARRAGLWVLIDFHQDAFSKEIGEDGAPLWAIKPPPEMLLQGPLTAEELTRRRTSSQVLRAFETFFGPSSDGVVLRGRFAAMAAEVARRFRGDEAIIGYEIFNEPIADDEQCLTLHRQVGEAIRAVDPTKLLVFEPPATRNIVDRATVPSEPFPLPGAVYAPHIYTLALVSSETARRTFTIDTLRPSHANAVREARAWGVPLLVGEWGYDPNGIRVEDYVNLQLDLQDEYGESAALWLWKERSQGSWGLFDYDEATGRWTERANYRRSLSRGPRRGSSRESVAGSSLCIRAARP
jgi:endoglycosylceramidase